MAGAVAKPGDVLTFTLTYNDNNIWGSKSYIQRVTDNKPAGLEYVANSATYKEGNEDWASVQEADKWFRLTPAGAVEFYAGNIFQAFGGPATSKVSFTWKYRVTDAIADGTYNTGTEIHFNPFNQIEKLPEMGPQLTIKRDAVAPGGSLGSPSLNSPSLPLPNLDSPSLESPNLGKSLANLFKAPAK